MLQIEDSYLKIAKEILAKYPYTFYAFGSRSKSSRRSRRLSDLDLCYKDEIPYSIAFLIEEDFKESDLPFKVDLIAWKHMSSSFQNLIKKDLIVI